MQTISGLRYALRAGEPEHHFRSHQIEMAAAGEGTKAGFKATNVGQPSIVAGQDPKFIGEGGWGFEIPVGAKNESAAIEFL